MRNIRFSILVIVMSIMSGCVVGRPGLADLVVTNARVWTGTGNAVTAVAIRGERIVAVGDNRVVGAWIGDQTRVIDTNGRRVTPGLIDSHIHVVGGGLQLGRLHLRDVGSREAFVAAVGRAASSKQESQWVLGGRWSVESWTNQTPPAKEWIDAATGDVPVFLTRMDGHQALVNSAALKIAGIDRDGPADPVGGVIERDPATGEPTGVLKDAAMELVDRHIPKPTEAERSEALQRAMRHLNAQGVTCAHDMSGPADLNVFRKAHRSGQLTVRIRKYLHVTDWTRSIDDVRRFNAGDDWFRINGFKGYMDGSLGSRTAYMYRPFADAHPHDEYPSGLLAEMAEPPRKLRWMIQQAAEARLQPAVHAIGDEANHVLLDAYEAVARKRGQRDWRPRVEHAQHLLPEDIDRFAKMGAIASMQPFHKADDGRYAEQALGSERLSGSYAYRSLIESGATVCFGSDWPVVTSDPFAGMAAAVTAKTLDGKRWIPEQAIEIEAALNAYTTSAAFAGFDENILGTITVGRLADIVVLSEDVLTVPAEEISHVRAWVTIVGGKVVYDAR